MLRKLISAFLSVSLLLTTFCLTVFAADYNHNFNDTTKTAFDGLSVLSLPNGTTAHGGRNYNTYKNHVTKFDYKEGLSGRPLGDYSAVFDIHAPNIREYEYGFNLLSTEWNSLPTATRTVEFSFLADGIFDKVQLSTRNAARPIELKSDGTIALRNEITSKKWNKNEWQRVAMTIYPLDTTLNYYPYDLWLNGEQLVSKKQLLASSASAGLQWSRIDIYRVNGTNDAQTNTVTTADDALLTDWIDARVAIDDYKEYSGTYVQPDSNKVSYSLANSKLALLSDTNTILMMGSTSVAEINSSLTLSNGTTAKIYDANRNLLTEGVVPNNGKLVLTSQDGRTYKYLRFTTDQSAREISTSNFESSQSVTVADRIVDGSNNPVYSITAREAGLFGKSDTAFVANTTGVPYNVQETVRYQFQSNCEPFLESNYQTTTKSTVTFEFSALVNGDMDYLQVYGRPRFVNLSNPTADIRGFKTYLKLNKNGTILANGDATVLNKQYKFGEWVRIAITAYPEDLTYKLYLNGELVANGYLDNSYKDNSLYRYGGFNWFSLGTTYLASETGTTNRNGKLATDDLHYYYGEYYYDSKNSTSISTTYPTDNNEGAIYIIGLQNGIEVSSFLSDVEWSSSTIAIYQDKTCTQTLLLDDNLSAGNVFVVKSENGTTFRYLTITSPEFSCDDSIDLYVNDVMTNILDVGMLKASITAYSPSYLNQKGCLILAVYKDGVLDKLVTDSKDLDGTTNFEASCEIDTLEGVTAKALFIDNLQNIKPYIESRPFVKVTQ